jgi:hypothetical protein
MSNIISGWENTLKSNRNKESYEIIVKYLADHKINCKTIENTTTRSIKSYNDYFIDNDDWAILFQCINRHKKSSDVQTLLISRANKPFSFRIGSMVISWDGYKVSKQKLTKIG